MPEGSLDIFVIRCLSIYHFAFEGLDRHSSAERVPELMTEDASQEQNVPQQIDLTGDDEEENVDNDLVDQNVNSESQQEESTDLVGDMYVLQFVSPRCDFSQLNLIMCGYLWLCSRWKTIDAGSRLKSIL